MRRFVDALRAAESASGKRVAYIGGIDLCHVGPEFGDPDPLDAATLDHVRSFDTAMLDHAAANDPAGWFGTAAKVGNRWRVCGLAATYTMLHAMGPARGRLLQVRPGGGRPPHLLRQLRQPRLRSAEPTATDPDSDSDPEVRNSA